MEKVDFYKLRRVFGKRSNFLVLGIALVVMMIFYPVDGKFRYQYKKGSPWLYETLVSPIDFPLLKTQQELAEERNRTLTRIAYQVTLQWPRSFAISPDGDFMFVCCQKYKAVQIFRIDKSSGYLSNGLQR